MTNDRWEWRNIILKRMKSVQTFNENKKLYKRQFKRKKCKKQ